MKKMYLVHAQLKNNKIRKYVLGAAICGALCMAAPAGTVPAAEKEETVYVIASADGTILNLISSDRLVNTDEAAVLADQSMLSQIENLKGDEAFTLDADGTLEWDAAGADIYYRADGSAEDAAALPVTVKLTYTLDGEEVTAQELEGKSGDLTIRIDYEYNDAMEAAYAKQDFTSGQDEEEKDTADMRIPFAAASAMLLDEDVFSDIEVVNGKAVTDGEHTAAIGIAFPGLAQDLSEDAFKSLSSLVDISLPEYVEIHAQVTDYTGSDVYTLVTNELFAAEDMDLSGMLDKADKALSSLQNGVTQIADGVTQLKDGAGDLKSGAADLSKGLETLSGKNEELLGGAEQVFTALLETARTQLTGAGLILPDEFTSENYGDILDALAQQLPQEAAAQVGALKEQLDQYQAFYAGLAEYTDGVAQAKEGADSVSDGASSLQSGALKLSLGTTVLKAALPDLGDAKDAMNEMIDQAKAYNSFIGIADETAGKVRFIWITR